MSHYIPDSVLREISFIPDSEMKERVKRALKELVSVYRIGEGEGSDRPNISDLDVACFLEGGVEKAIKILAGDNSGELMAYHKARLYPSHAKSIYAEAGLPLPVKHR